MHGSRLALIPPPLHDRFMVGRPYQLLLPQHLDGSSWLYSMATMEALGESDTFMILDNGEAEGARRSPMRLLELADSVCVQEIVVPDVIGDPYETRARALAFEQYVDLARSKRFMGVVHGNPYEQQDLVRFYNNLGWINTIGIPRHLAGDDMFARVNITEWIETYYPNFATHWLGTNPTCMEEVRFLPPGVRSIDTSAPFNYAFAGVSLALDPKAVVHRPEGYHMRRMASDELIMAQMNVQTMEGWIRESEASTRRVRDMPSQ